MSHFRRQSLIVVLALALVHVPVPWWHRHECLDAIALAAHSASYHRGCKKRELPQGWHLHFLQAEAAVGPLANRERPREKSEAWQEGWKWLGGDLHAGCTIGCAKTWMKSLGACPRSLRTAGLPASMGRQLYLQLCVLRL